MAKILISRAGGKKEYEVTNEQARKISNAVDSARKSGVAKLIKFEHLEFMSTDYKGAEYDAERKTDNAMVEQAKRWHEQRRTFAKKTPQEKTERFMRDGFMVLRSSIPDMSIDQMQAVRERVLEFFRENPRRCYPDGITLKGDYDQRNISMWDTAKFRILERVIGEDASACKSDELYEKGLMGIKTVEQVGFDGEISEKELSNVF